MEKTYIVIHVYDDGDNELKKLRLSEKALREILLEGDLYFTVPEIAGGKLKKELLSYGNTEQDINEALSYIIRKPPESSCIIGKIEG